MRPPMMRAAPPPYRHRDRVACFTARLRKEFKVLPEGFGHLPCDRREVVSEVGFEPTRPKGRRILSPLRLPGFATRSSTVMRSGGDGPDLRFLHVFHCRPISLAMCVRRAVRTAHTLCSRTDKMVAPGGNVRASPQEFPTPSGGSTSKDAVRNPTVKGLG